MLEGGDWLWNINYYSQYSIGAKLAFAYISHLPSFISVTTPTGNHLKKKKVKGGLGTHLHQIHVMTDSKYVYEIYVLIQEHNQCVFRVLGVSCLYQVFIYRPALMRRWVIGCADCCAHPSSLGRHMPESWVEMDDRVCLCVSVSKVSMDLNTYSLKTN